MRIVYLHVDVMCSLTSPPVVHTGLACVKFYYYMWGVDVAVLIVATRNLGIDNSWLKLSGHHGARWWFASVSVSLTNNTDRVLHCTALIHHTIALSVGLSHSLCIQLRQNSGP